MAAFPFGELPEDTVIPIALRAPEVILKSAFDHHIDVWSFGCLAFEILTGDNLFSVFPLPIDLDDQIDDDHLLQIANTLGPIPSSIFARWSRGSRCLDGDMNHVWDSLWRRVYATKAKGDESSGDKAGAIISKETRGFSRSTTSSLSKGD
ncbi:unnamed protein product [Zymoseptoria tritici ST99CH_1A5]|uniref:Serine-threonine/tyrosine-protein kinase catalytic domain-containing protein n=1 Tax=Zymoseptoria tritici ST99CH_1A5 TaxID=1276529 RepID=A0A1Y6LLS7_ZYMTR|nr:unnamed protein product [Zymoseptoria tritici ST99CH_1A5]